MDPLAIMVAVILIAGALLAFVIQVANGWSEWSSSQKVCWREAHQRAEVLLKEILTASEYVQLGERGYLEVPSPSQPTRTYRVPRRGGRVSIVESGVEVECLCIAPVESVPPGDVIITHKLMIEGDEQEYLRRANHYRLRLPGRFVAT
jgi:hypothetical protein